MAVGAFLEKTWKGIWGVQQVLIMKHLGFDVLLGWAAPGWDVFGRGCLWMEGTGICWQGVDLCPHWSMASPGLALAGPKPWAALSAGVQPRSPPVGLCPLSPWRAERHLSCQPWLPLGSSSEVALLSFWAFLLGDAEGVFRVGAGQGAQLLGSAIGAICKCTA